MSLTVADVYATRASCWKLRREIVQYGYGRDLDAECAQLEQAAEIHHEPACEVCAGTGCGGCRWTGHQSERNGPS